MKELFRKPLELTNKKCRKEIGAINVSIERFNERKSKLYDLFTLEEIDKSELLEKRLEYDAEIMTLQISAMF